MNRELVMSTLFAQLQQPPMVFNFTADIGTGMTQLGNVSDTSGLTIGMPISGPGIPDFTTLATITPDVTISLPAVADVTGSAITQGFQTYSRRLAVPGDEVDMPVMYLLDVGEEHPARESNRPYLALIHCQLWIFSKAGEDPSAVPAEALNCLIDAIERSLYPTGSQPGGGLRQPLGLRGVHYCRIEGEIQKDPGHDGRLAGAIIPIRIAVFPNLETQLIAPPPPPPSGYHLGSGTGDVLGSGTGDVLGTAPPPSSTDALGSGTGDQLGSGTGDVLGTPKP